jgi:hypothetical protein
MKKYKSILGWAVMTTDKELMLKSDSLMDFTFRTKRRAEMFRGKNKADIVRIIIKPII